MLDESRPDGGGNGEAKGRAGLAIASVRGLTKEYGEFRALDGVTLEIRPGEVYGLLGPNGSGKTTTIRILLGFLRATSGEAEAFGFDCWRESVEVRRRVGFLPGELRLIGHMTGYGMLRFLSELRDPRSLDRAVAIAEDIMGLDLRRKVRAYSTGMKQKLALSQAFADPVELLILDEPTSALDPSARSLVLELVRQARAEGQTVVFSGHVLSEVEEICDRVAILRRGELMHIEDLHQRRSGLRLVLARFHGEVPASWPEELGLSVRERRGERIVLFEHRGEAIPLLGWLASQPVADLAIGTDDLRTLYDRYHGPEAEGAT
jgi:ABC-2 type transport system ATP-binding protein